MQIEWMVAALRLFAAVLTIGLLWPVLLQIWQRTRADRPTGNSEETRRNTRRVR